MKFWIFLNICQYLCNLPSFVNHNEGYIIIFDLLKSISCTCQLWQRISIINWKKNYIFGIKHTKFFIVCKRPNFHFYYNKKGSKCSSQNTCINDENVLSEAKSKSIHDYRVSWKLCSRNIFINVGRKETSTQYAELS